MAAAPRLLPAFILLTLAEGPQHGHAIRAVLAERYPGHTWDAGATYRALQTMEEAGEVAFQWDTDSRGPARKVYTLTPSGWERLDQWRSEVETRLGMLQSFLERHKRTKAKGKRAAK